MTLLSSRVLSMRYDALNSCIDCYEGQSWYDFFCVTPKKVECDFELYEKIGTSEFILRKRDRQIWIIITGSNGDDWFGVGGNLSVRLTTPITKKVETKIKVASGILHCWRKEIKRKTIEFINYHLDMIDEIIVTGHSKGGAVAKVAAQNLAYKFKEKNVRCFSFSSSRAGNKAFYDDLYNLAYVEEWSNKGDLVPHVPFGFLGYYKNEKRIKVKIDKSSLLQKILSPFTMHVPLYTRSYFEKELNEWSTDERY